MTMMELQTDISQKLSCPPFIQRITVPNSDGSPDSKSRPLDHFQARPHNNRSTLTRLNSVGIYFTKYLAAKNKEQKRRWKTDSRQSKVTIHHVVYRRTNPGFSPPILSPVFNPPRKKN